ncbi:hypothetical protein, partial [Bosea sp. (in: a-proteobacteria)]
AAASAIAGAFPGWRRLAASSRSRHRSVKWHGYCDVFQTRRHSMMRHWPGDAKAAIALFAVSAAGILGWLASGL